MGGRGILRIGAVGTGVVTVVVVSRTGGGVVIAGRGVGRGVTIDFATGVEAGSSFTVGSVDRSDVGRGDGVVAGVGTTRGGA